MFKKIKITAVAAMAAIAAGCIGSASVMAAEGDLLKMDFSELSPYVNSGATGDDNVSNNIADLNWYSFDCSKGAKTEVFKLVQDTSDTEIDGGYYILNGNQSASNYQMAAWHPDKALLNYSVKTKFKITNGSKDKAVYVIAKGTGIEKKNAERTMLSSCYAAKMYFTTGSNVKIDKKNYKEVGFQIVKLELDQNENGGYGTSYKSEEVLAAGSEPKYIRVTAADAAWHGFEIKVEGSKLSAYFDGDEVVSAEDNSLSGSAAGIGAMVSKGNVYFDDLTVTSLDNTAVEADALENNGEYSDGAYGWTATLAGSRLNDLGGSAKWVFTNDEDKTAEAVANIGDRAHFEGDGSVVMGVIVTAEAMEGNNINKVEFVY